MNIFTLLTLFISLNIFGSEVRHEMIQAYRDRNYQQAEAIERVKSKIVGIEILIAGEGNAIESKMGHGLIRLIDNDPYWTNDTVVSFGAFTEGESLSSIKGFIGGYDILGDVKTLHAFWKDYSQKESRPLNRYVLSLTKNEIENVIDSLIDHMKNPKKLGTYRFLTNNCMTVISKIIKNSGIKLKDQFESIPKNVEKWLDTNQLSPYPPFIIQTPKMLFANLNEQMVMSETADEVINKYSIRELYYIYESYPLISIDLTQKIRALLRRSNVDYTSTLNFQVLPKTLYQKCFDIICFEGLNKAEQTSLYSNQRVQSYLKRILKRKGYYSQIRFGYSQVTKFRPFGEVESVRMIGEERIKTVVASVGKTNSARRIDAKKNKYYNVKKLRLLRSNTFIGVDSNGDITVNTLD